MQIDEQTPGLHSQFLESIVKDFCGYFAPGGSVVYVNDSRGARQHIEKAAMQELGVSVALPHKMPIIFAPSLEAQDDGP